MKKRSKDFLVFTILISAAVILFLVNSLEPQPAPGWMALAAAYGLASFCVVVGLERHWR